MNIKVDEAKPAARTVPTLDTLTPSQIAAIRSIPPHDQAVPPAIDEHRPVSLFTDEARYRLEQEKIFRKLPVPLTLSVMLPGPGWVLAHEGHGIPILLTRDKEGKVRAFLNACKH